MKTVVQILQAVVQHHGGIDTTLYVIVATSKETRVYFVRYVVERTDSYPMLPWFSVRRVRSGYMLNVIM